MNNFDQNSAKSERPVFFDWFKGGGPDIFHKVEGGGQNFFATHS